MYFDSSELAAGVASATGAAGTAEEAGAHPQGR